MHDGSQGIEAVFKSLSFAVMWVALVFVGADFAQAKNKTNCHCVVPANSTGQILSLRGDVRVSLPSGFSSAKPGVALSLGSLIIVGLQSDAQIQFGGCRLNILPLRDVSFDATDRGEICVRVTPADGRRAGFDPEVTAPLGTLGATFAKPATASARAPAAAVKGAGGGIPTAAIVAGAVVVGGVAIALAASETAADVISTAGTAVITEIIDEVIDNLEPPPLPFPTEPDRWKNR